MKTTQPVLVDSGNGLSAAGLVHRVWEPDGDGPHRTIVMLHGRSGNEDVTWAFGRTLPKNTLIVSPRALYEDHRGGYSWDVRTAGEWPPLDALNPAIDSLNQFLTALPHLYNANLEQLYLLGFSQGCAVCYRYAMLNPGKVQAIAALVGLMPVAAAKEPEITNLNDLPVFMAVGRRDDTLPLPVSHECAQALITGGARLDYREYNTGHKLNVRGMKDLTAWWQQVVPDETA